MMQIECSIYSQEGFGKMNATERHYVPLAKLATINEEVTFKEKEDALFLKVNTQKIKTHAHRTKSKGFKE